MLSTLARRAGAAAAALALAATPVAAAHASSADTRRLAGADRFGTAVAVSQYVSNREAGGAGDYGPVFIASAEAFPDGLGAGAAAGSMKGRLLLVPRDGVLPAAVAAELDRLKSPFTVIVGGTGVVSSRMEAQIKAHSPNIMRLDGADRYETAAIVGSGSESDVLFVAAGADFPDGLSGGAAAAALDSAVLLTARTALPASTREVVRSSTASTIVVLGGTGAVSDTVLAQLRAARPGATVVRAAGADRYATAAAASRFAFPGGSRTVYLATGSAFPDSLPAGAAAGGEPAPLLLSRATCVPRATLAEIARLGATRFVAVGGTGALSQAVVDRVPCAS